MSQPSPHIRNAAIDRLRAAGCVYAEDEAGLLIAEAGNGGGLEDRVLETMLARRVAGEPLEQILGWAEFCGLKLAVRPGVFVPRRRTELLVREALARCAAGDIVVDLCCGVGAVGVAITRAMSSSGELDLYATDVDPIAVDCARRNGVGVVRVLAGDLFAPLPSGLRGRVSVITANAPYVPTEEIALMPSEARDHEVPTALDGGRDGLDLHRRIIAEAPAWLRPGGHLLIETGRRQAATDLDLLSAAGFQADLIIDEEIDGTAVVGRLFGGP